MKTILSAVALFTMCAVVPCSVFSADGPVEPESPYTLPPDSQAVTHPPDEFVSPAGEFEYYGHADFSGEQLYPYDGPDPWLHGYIQEVPAFPGYKFFKPHNFRHVLAQSRAAERWGMPTQMPHSQQFWHKYTRRAAMRKRASENDTSGQSIRTVPRVPQLSPQVVPPQPVPPQPATPTSYTVPAPTGPTLTLPAPGTQPPRR